MPEMIQFEDLPAALVGCQIEPFREEYIPGSRLLGREWSDKGYSIFFHIPTPVAQKMDERQIQTVQGQIRGWWRDRTTQADAAKRPA
jgi:hypothetical protein